MNNFFKNLTGNIKNYNYLWKYKVIWCLPLIFFLIFLDWISKAIVAKKMILNGSSIEFIKNFLSFQYVINPGAAYGMNSDNLALAISIAFFASFAIFALFIFNKNKFWLIPISLMLSGSFANLLARAWAPPTSDNVKGGVIDFLKFEFSFIGSNEFIFNLADAWVSIAVGFIIVLFIVYIICELLELKMRKKNLEKFNFYNDIKQQKEVLFEVFYKNFKNNNNLKYKEYLARQKQLDKQWKEYKSRA